MTSPPQYQALKSKNTEGLIVFSKRLLLHTPIRIVRNIYYFTRFGINWDRFEARFPRR